MGTEGDIGGGDQTSPGDSIKGPTGSTSSPPHDYIRDFNNIVILKEMEKMVWLEFSSIQRV